MNNPYKKYKGFTEGPYKCSSQGIIHTDDSPLERAGICQIMGHPDAKETKANIALHVDVDKLLEDCRDMWELLDHYADVLDDSESLQTGSKIRALLKTIEARHKAE